MTLAGLQPAGVCHTALAGGMQGLIHLVLNCLLQPASSRACAPRARQTDLKTLVSAKEEFTKS
jgi:hypothetical protein